ncbi:DUF3892 domain-containing protein [Clostridium felsineum]|uniref:Uncharacterized protein n=1 Tax=Clostridium felsineum TaxID=36839 RepID=A0A1S8L0V9_9CLOT|nr:DUF3892 domain-containing protein [Clostridium felsineum]MCR3758254.1 DUF3892 domain-containing protein [Clostridium felsineum]URZ01208.1 hypothetical protein CLAUR_011960 [Clostridium felsineum]URZ06036.1 hypothetical protein CLROS_013690 [Clostridium felsineum]URZ11073.1 hypothetical protein CROST_017900 [Clostridium felsineum]URZ15702.1 hypothetical protein CLFE_017490 [Clostridium felsineum DSM 794]
MKNVYDYGIYAVHYDKNDKSNIIQFTKVCFIKNNNVSMPIEFSRDFLIADIEDGNKYYTMYKKNNRWEKKECVNIKYINGNPYVKINLNNLESDELGELPEY